MVEFANFAIFHLPTSLNFSIKDFLEEISVILQVLNPNEILSRR
jgi:hypothetical protein